MERSLAFALPSKRLLCPHTSLASHMTGRELGSLQEVPPGSLKPWVAPATTQLRSLAIDRLELLGYGLDQLLSNRDVWPHLHTVLYLDTSFYRVTDFPDRGLPLISIAQRLLERLAAAGSRPSSCNNAGGTGAEAAAAASDHGLAGRGAAGSKGKQAAGTGGAAAGATATAGRNDDERQAGHVADTAAASTSANTKPRLVCPSNQPVVQLAVRMGQRLETRVLLRWLHTGGGHEGDRGQWLGDPDAVQLLNLEKHAWHIM